MNAPVPTYPSNTLSAADRVAAAVTEAVTQVHHVHRAFDALGNISFALSMIRLQISHLGHCGKGLARTEARRAELAAEMQAIASQLVGLGNPDSDAALVSHAHRRGAALLDATEAARVS